MENDIPLFKFGPSTGELDPGFAELVSRHHTAMSGGFLVYYGFCFVSAPSRQPLPMAALFIAKRMEQSPRIRT